MPQALSLDHVSPATRLLEKRRQMFEVQDELARQKEEFARREEAFARREDQLRLKDAELQASLVKFNKFLQENEAKRTRALKRAADEAGQRRAKEGEVEKLQQVVAAAAAAARATTFRPSPLPSRLLDPLHPFFPRRRRRGAGAL